MKTERLLKALNMCKPSLGSNDSVLPVLTHFCFDDDIVYSYNDVTAIIVPENTGLRCALHGDTLVGLLEACGDEEIQFKSSTDGSMSNLKFGSGGVTIPTLSPDTFLFKYPESEFPFKMKLSPDIASGFGVCMLSVSDDSIKPEYSGVTLKVDPDGIVFFSTDNSTASRYKSGSKLIGRKTISVVFPQQACQHLLKLLSVCGYEDASIEIGEQCAIASFQGAILVTKVFAANPESFEKVFEQHADNSDFVSLPDGIGREMQKAQIILARDNVKECKLEFDGNSVTVSATGIMGSLKSKLKSKGVGNVIVKPDLLLRVLPYAEAMAVNDDKSLVFKNNCLTYIISTLVK